MPTQQTTEAKSKSSSAKSRQRQVNSPAPQSSLEAASPLAVQAALEDPASATPGAILQLQRTAGNQAVSRLLTERRIQAKLSVGPAGDKYEQEADRVAAQVMNSVTPTSPNQTQRLENEDEEAGLQRFPLAASVTTLRRRTQAASSPTIQKSEQAAPARAPGEGFEADSQVEHRISANQGGGKPLAGETRSFMESRFGADFGGVNIHTGQESNQLNRQLSAQAFTHGRDIYFGEGKYNPGTSSGKSLLAHELTHVVQQGGAVARQMDPAVLHNQQTAAFTKVARQVIQRDDTVEGGEGAKTDVDADPVLPEKFPLTSESDKALTAAETANPDDYGVYKPVVKAYMPDKHQKQVNDIQGFFQRVKGNKKDLRDYLRAFLLSQYANVLYSLYTDPEKVKQYPTDKAKETRRDKTYLPKALETRDKYKPLLAKGVSAPETQAFLTHEGFAAALPLSESEKADQASAGPRIEVRATFIGGKILGMAVRAHLFIIYTNSEGKQWYYRGGPGESGTTVADMGEYVPGTVDWDPSAPSKTVLAGPEAKAKADALAEATTVIDGLQVPYVAFTGVKEREGENCNATVWTILDRAGIPKNKPFGFHPGWGHVLGQALKQGTGTMAAKETEEDNNVPGYPQVLKGGPGDEVQIYADRAGAEKLTSQPGGTEVDMVRDSRFKEDTDFIKIRFGDKQIGFVNIADVQGRSGKPYLIKGDGSHMVVVYELNAMKPTEDFLAGGESVDVVDPVTDEAKPVRIWYDSGGQTRCGRVSSAELVEKPKAPPKAALTPAQYPAGNTPVGPIAQGVTFQAAITPDGPLDRELEFYPGDRFVIKVTDDLTTQHGRCEIELMHVKHYVPLDVVMDPVEEEEEDVDDPLARYAHIPNGRPSLLMPAGKRMQVYAAWDSVDLTEYVFTEDSNLRMIVADDLKKRGICKVDVMGTGRHFYGKLDDLFGEDGRPTTAKVGDSVAVVPEPEEDVSDEGGEGGSGEVVDTGPTEEEKRKAYDKAKQVFGEMDGFDLQVIMSGALDGHTLKLALTHKDGVAAELAELSGGHLTADEITHWATGG